MVTDSIEDFQSVFQKASNEECFVIPILANELIALESRLIGLYFYFYQNKEDYLVLGNHSEALFEGDLSLFTFEGNNKKYVLDKKQFLHLFPESKNVIDLEMTAYINGIKITPPKLQKYFLFKRLYPKFKDVNILVPVLILLEWCSSILDEINHENLKNLPINFFYNDLVLENFSRLEKAGIQVNDEIFNQHFQNKSQYVFDGKIYANYNLYTTIGRPSNVHHGINFVALNKKNGSRDAFVSRFGDEGCIVEFDYQAYHPRLIASYTGYQLSKEISVYELLAQQYFPNTPITEELLKESKQITFRQLYGGVEQQYKHIPFFEYANKLLEGVNNTYLMRGYIESPYSDKKLLLKAYDKNKLFNYFFQLQETERNMVVMQKVLDYLQGLQSKMILYVYDSFVIDVLNEEIVKNQVLLNIKKIMEDTDFVVNINKGKSYGDVKKIIL